MFQGKNADAIAALPAAVKRDRDEQNTFGAVAKLLALAEAYAAGNHWPEAHRTLEEARKLSQDDSVLVTTARLSIASGRIDRCQGDRRRARAEAAGAEPRLRKDDRSGDGHDGETISRGHRCAQQRPGDSPISGWSATRPASSTSIAVTTWKRYPSSRSARSVVGEATALFLDDLPTFRYYALVPYWLGRSREMRGLDAKPQYRGVPRHPWRRCRRSAGRRRAATARVWQRALT